LITLQANEDFVNSAHFSPDGQRIVTISPVRVWEAQSGKLIATLRGGDGIESAQFSPDGQRIITASLYQPVRIWDAQNGKLLATLQGIWIT
jgi:WD40 repeat protein